MKGKVKWYNSKKGYGFIVDNDNNLDYFLHYSQLPNGYIPKDNEKCEFDGIETTKGKQAKNIVFIK